MGPSTRRVPTTLPVPTRVISACVKIITYSENGCQPRMLRSCKVEKLESLIFRERMSTENSVVAKSVCFSADFIGVFP